MRFSTIFLFFLLTIKHSLFAAFDYRESSPVSMFPYNYAALDYSIPGTISNPAYLPLLDSTYISSSADMPYSDSEIYTTNLRTGISFKNTGFQTGFSRFGIDEYREHVVDFSMGHQPSKYFSIGYNFNYYNISINCENILLNEHLSDSGISILFIPSEKINFSFKQDNIRSIFNSSRRDLLYPEFSTGISIIPVKGFSLIYNYNRAQLGRINTFIVSANILSYLNIRAGYSRETLSYSSALSFLLKNISASYGLRYHAYLGLTHSIGVTITYDKIKYDRLSYRNPIRRDRSNLNIKKIDINKAAIGSIRKIPILKTPMPERIISYREMIGPITKKSLMQIGLTAKEINTLSSYVYGLKKEKSKFKYKKKWKKYSRKKKKYLTFKEKKIKREQKKLLFKKLLTTGISPSLALKISQIASGSNKKKIIKAINSIENINKSQKIRIKKLCLE